jgi:hydrogenase maturation protease
VSTVETLVVGLGNRMRGDDGAGLEVARMVGERAPGVRAVEHEREPSDLIELWADAELAIVVDAVQGGEPGAIHRVAVGPAELRPRSPAGASSHALGLGEVIELARALDRLPGRLIVFGIEGERFDTGAGLSVPARRAVAEAAERVLAELGAAGPSS